MLAIIGGSGLTQLSSLNVSHREVVRTPYGEPSGALMFGHVQQYPVVFLARHGYGHTIPPHRVNYRANIWALKSAKVSRVVSVSSVGGIRAGLAPGKLVVPHQIIDYTWGRRMTFHDGLDEPVVHIDFTEPYDAALRARILAAARLQGETIEDGAVYGALQGPRLETAAEIWRMERDGVDIVGMTGMPEAVLAREAGIAYAAICPVANFAAGRGDSVHGVRFDAIEAVLHDAVGRVRRIIDGLCLLDD